MIIGVPKEIKNHEYRVSIKPDGVKELVNMGHKIYVQKGAGIGSGYLDEDYLNNNAILLDTIEDIYKGSDMIVKVKEPIDKEYPLIRESQIIFTYLHLSANKKLVEALIRSRSICLAYETLKINGTLELLAPMSEVAGRLSVIVGSYYLGVNFKGQGLLISGISGVLPGNILILGAGIAGKSAAKIAAGLGANVTIMSPFISELREIELHNYFPPNVRTLILSDYNLLTEIEKADILISAVYVRGAKTPVLVKRELVKKMKKGSVIVAIDIDQGSSIETAKPTTHIEPIYVEEGVVHYCVANMPGIFAKTSTAGLTNLTLPIIKRLSCENIEDIIRKDAEIRSGLNIYKGKITNMEVARDLDMMDCYEELFT